MSGETGRFHRKSRIVQALQNGWLAAAKPVAQYPDPNRKRGSAGHPNLPIKIWLQRGISPMETQSECLASSDGGRSGGRRMLYGDMRIVQLGPAQQSLTPERIPFLHDAMPLGPVRTMVIGQVKLPCSTVRSLAEDFMEQNRAPWNLTTAAPPRFNFDVLADALVRANCNQATPTDPDGQTTLIGGLGPKVRHTPPLTGSQHSC